MEIVIAAGGMPFGPNTLNVKSLGGSETAVIMTAKHLKSMGHIVTVFAPLPERGQPDYHENGMEGEDGVRYVHINNYPAYIANTQCDLLVASRDPRLIHLNAQAKKRVLWCHDIATHRGMQTAFDQINWCMDEVWCVSEFHRNQIHKVTGYPKAYIKVVPNGIVPVETIPAPRSENQLVYAARPERGLENLIKKGGIMEHLPEFELKVAMYDHFPDDMKAFYEWCFARIKELPNVEIIGSLPQQQMRQLISDSAAYIYPTQFEETSCILARECIEQGTPFLTTKVGALPETLGHCGTFFEDWSDITPGLEGGPLWCAEFALFVKKALSDYGDIARDTAQDFMARRDDLYWNNAAEKMIKLSKPKPVKLYSRAWSLVQDGDIIPAYALLTEAEELDQLCMNLARQIETFYPFIRDEDDEGYESLASYYKRFYEYKRPEINYGIDYARGTTRYETIKKAIAETTQPGDLIYEYGCGEGHISGPLAKDFPDRHFVAFDQVQENVDRVNKFRDDFGTVRLEAHRVDDPQAAFKKVHGVPADAVICVEVLEHCVRPWEVAQGVEAMVKPGKQVIITTPYGAWEPQSFEAKADEFPWRNHIWHLDKTAAREMFGKKPAITMMSLASGTGSDARSIGNLFYTYEADHQPIPALNALKKAKAAWSRQTVAVAVICMNDEDTILHMLHSLDRQVQFVQFAMGPSTDRTRDLIHGFFEDHPHMNYRILNVPAITPALKHPDGRTNEGFGFDHARNQSTVELDGIFDWILWMDTDEYLSGNLGKYLRANMLDGYLIPQHHFTAQPRGAPIQIDRPARLFRTGRGYEAKGHVHEHFEKPGGGPGACYMPPDVDLGHTGYVNEDVRRDRFSRNFPFLCWDHADNPDRKLGKFLWFRDIIHRMRWEHSNGDQEKAVALAKEAEAYYTAEWKLMATFGQGTFQAIEYLAEARSLLGIGTEVMFGVKLDDRDCTIKGRFTSTVEITRILKQILDPEFKRRGSKYY